MEGLRNRRKGVTGSLAMAVVMMMMMMRSAGTVLVMMRKGAMAARNMVAMTLMMMRRRSSSVTSITTTRGVVMKTMTKTLSQCWNRVLLLSFILLNKKLSHIYLWMLLLCLFDSL
uniref:Uncharacterized protein n=1 Tax=Brassica campestris TaxID=3711 RepID=A0A3P6CY95_BRACM|nr:unnamed protein product [Brassica rapa]